jgi:FkbM family methyltransferase
MIEKIKSILSRIISKLKTDPNKFLWKVSGVIHVGANIGQERDLYAKYGLHVVWIEPIPDIFERLKANLTDYPTQRALECLVTDKNGMEYQFHIANNDGASSSILYLNRHKDIWPHVNYVRTVKLRSKTLTTLLAGENIDLRGYDALIMDTQGSELLVLKGAVPIIQNFTYIKAEVPDFESYIGCCQLSDIERFLKHHGYKEFSRYKFAERPNVGNYYDIVYRRTI